MMHQQDSKLQLPSISTAALILKRKELVKPRRRYRRAHPGWLTSMPARPIDLCLHHRCRHRGVADYKWQFRLKNGKYCFPLTVSDLSTRYLLGVDAHPAISQEKTVAYFREIFGIYQASGRSMPKRIGTYDFPSHFLVRRVSRAGTIRVFHNQVFVSNTLHEDYVGLEEVADGVYDLCFCFNLIGRYELRTNMIHGIVSKVGLTVRRIDHCHSVYAMSLE
jgi:hypothetical protein